MLIFYKFLMHFTHNDLFRYLLFYLYLRHMNVREFRLSVFVHIEQLKKGKKKKKHIHIDNKLHIKRYTYDFILH